MTPNKRPSVANNYSLSVLRDTLNNHKPRKDLFGIKNPSYKDGNGESYHRLRIKGKKVRVSHIVWRLHHKRIITKGFHIHHIDKNKRNNSIENLELIEARQHGNNNLRKGSKKE